MKRTVSIVVIILAALFTGYWMHWRVQGEVWDFDDLGLVRVFPPNGEVKNVYIVISQDSNAALAKSLYTANTLVAHIRFNRYRNAVAKDDANCTDVVTLLDVFYQQLEQRYHVSHYQKPILIGEGEAAPLIYSILASSPKNMFAAGVSSEFKPDLNFPKVQCGQAWPIGAGKISLPTDINLSAPWFVKFAPGVNKIHFSGKPEIHEVLDKITSNSIFRQVMPVLAAAKSASPVNDLPLIELPANGDSNYFAIVVSGDGGWANIDKEIGDALVEKGVSTVGINALQYLWQPKTPESAGKDLQRIIEHYKEVFQKSKVVVLGFSLGADVLPLMVKNMSESARNSVAGVVLLSPGTDVHYEFHVTEWWTNESDDPGIPLIPAIESLNPTPVLCIYGTDEDDESSCPQLKGQHVIKKGLPGDHHFNDDYEAVIKLIEETFPSRTTAGL